MRRGSTAEPAAESESASEPAESPADAPAVDGHPEDVPDGAGCTEIWERVGRRDESGAETADGDDADDGPGV